MTRALLRGALLGSISIVAATLPAVAQSTSGGGIETVTVTAEKRSQNIQDVPAQVTALTGGELANMHAVSLQDLEGYIPGLNIQPLGSAGLEFVTIDGIPPTASTTAARVYIDETPMGSSSGFVAANVITPDVMPYDIERVEVLGGPQGTLYGANAMSGVIKYVLTQPDPTKFSAEVGADVFGIQDGGGAGEQTRAMVNIPFDDTLAARGTFYQRFTPGYIDDVVTGDKNNNAVHQIGGRASVLWQPTSQLSIQAQVLDQHLLQNNSDTVSYDATTHRPLPGAGALSNDFYLPEKTDIEILLYDLTGKYDFGWANLTSASSYQIIRTTTIGDLTASLRPIAPLIGLPSTVFANFPENPKVSKFTQELRLTSEQGGPVDWLFGGYFTHEITSQTQSFLAYSSPGMPYPPPINPLELATLDSSYIEYAGFANATWHITDALDLAGGARYSYNDQRYRQGLGGYLLGGTETFPLGKSHEGVFTWDVNPSYHFDQNDMVYVRIAKGFQPGAPNAIPFDEPDAPKFYVSSTLVDYEAGLKSIFLDGKALADISAFYIDWTKIQVPVVDLKCNCTTNGNGGGAKSKGVNFNGNYSPFDGLLLGANLAYTDATISDPIPTLNAPSGARLLYVPKWTWSLTATYTMPLGNSWNFEAGAGFRHGGSSWSGVQGSFQRDYLPPPDNKVPTAFLDPAYNQLDLHIGVSDDTWRLQLYARNVTNDLYLRGEGYATVLSLGTPYEFQGTISQPRTIGISVDKSF
ncbi:MAG TPA: TonB-dependent receptor [Rhizomicrobium sp.]|jgi:outer membrane receptor protein involved in Fe transport